MTATTVRKRIVEQVIEGFRTGNHAMVSACVTDDVTWQMPPLFELSGRSAFADAIGDDAACRSSRPRAHPPRRSG